MPESILSVCMCVYTFSQNIHGCMHVCAYLQPEYTWQNEGHRCEAGRSYEAHQVCKEWKADGHKCCDCNVQAPHDCSHQSRLFGWPELLLCHGRFYVLKHRLSKDLQNKPFIVMMPIGNHRGLITAESGSRCHKSCAKSCAASYNCT